MRRKVGAGRAIKSRQDKQAYQDRGQEITEANTDHMQKQMKLFKEKLEEFAVKHKSQINKDPEFRSKFQKMCAKIGVDPLSSNKGFWAEVLGVGTFYFELGVQIVHVCLATREVNGGVMKLNDLVLYLQRIRKKGNQQPVIEEDVKRAVATLEPLGNGIRFIQVGMDKMLASVPVELSSDHTSLLNVAHQGNGCTNVQVLTSSLKWTNDRAERALATLLTQSIAWVDEQSSDGVIQYYFPSIVFSLV